VSVKSFYFKKTPLLNKTLLLRQECEVFRTQSTRCMLNTVHKVTVA